MNPAQITPRVYSKYKAFDDVQDLFVDTSDRESLPSIGLRQSTGEAKNVYVSFNGRTVVCESHTKGIELLPLREGIEKYSHLLEGYTNGRILPAKEDAVSKESRNIIDEGYFLYIHPDTFREYGKENTITVYTSIGQEDISAYAHNCIIVGKGNAVRIVEEHLPIAFGGKSVASIYIECFCDESSDVSYIAITTPSEGVYMIKNMDWYLFQNSRIDMVDNLLGGAAVRQNIRAYLIGEGASYDLHGLGVATGSQSFETNALISNRAKHTSGKVLYKNIVSDSAKLACDGLIRIEKQADFTDSYLESHTVVLSDNARADAVPSLEIEANEVKASHGATIGNIDENQLLYAMSRGLGKKEAESLIIAGYIKPIIDKIHDDAIEERITGYFTKKLHG